MNKDRFPIIILMNKLLEDKRYNDVMMLSQHELSNKNVPGIEFTNIVAHTALEMVIESFIFLTNDFLFFI